MIFVLEHQTAILSAKLALIPDLKTGRPILGFVWFLENLESPGILLWHFPGLESPGKRLMVLESSVNLLNSSKSMKCMTDSKEN